MGRTLGRATVAIAAAAVMTVAGCGSSSEAAPGGTGQGASAPQVDWVGQMCAGVGTVVDTVTRQPAVDTSNTAALPAAYSGQLREIGGSVDGVLAKLDQLGPPPGAGGEQALADLRASVTSTRDAIRASEQAIAASNASSPVGFVQSQRAVETGYTAGRVLLDEIGEQAQLRDSFAAAPSCQEVDARADGRPGSA